MSFVRISAFYKNSYGHNSCWTRKQIAEFGCLETWKGKLPAGCLLVCCSAFYKAIENIVMLDQKWVTTPWCLRIPKANRDHTMSVGLLLCPLQKIERISQMFCFCSFATQTGISGILDGIKLRRGSSSFLALSLYYYSRIPKALENAFMWRAWKPHKTHWHDSLVFLPSFIHQKQKLPKVHVSGRRLSLPFFPKSQPIKPCVCRKVWLYRISK